MASTFINLPATGDPAWKTPVSSSAALPATNNTVGDARVTDDTSAIYIWSGSAWVEVSGGGGGVSSVALSDGSSTPIYNISGSPVTTSGTLTFTLANATANQVFAGPTSGSPAQPGFRALVSGDIPNNAANTSGSAASVTSSSTHPATAGVIQLADADAIEWRNHANGGNISLAKNTSDQLTYAGTTVLSASGVLLAAAAPAFTGGDVTSSAGSLSLSLVATSNSTLTTLSGLTTASSLVTVGTISSGTWRGTTMEIAHGGTGATSVTTAPTASAFAGWDASSNLSANNLIDGWATTVTSSGTVALTVTSASQQYFTGSTTGQVITLPVVATGPLPLGFQFTIVNLSSVVITVESSGGNTLQAMAANTQLVCTSILQTGTGTASWNWTYSSIQAALPGGASEALVGAWSALGF